MMSLLLVASPTKVWAGTTVGIITDLKGKVTINGKNAELLREVETGAIMIGQAGSKITVSFSKDGHQESVSGNFNIKVSGNALISTKKGKKDAITRIMANATTVPLKLSAAITPTSSTPATGPMRGIFPNFIPIYPIPGEIISSNMPSFRFVNNTSKIETLNYVIVRKSGDPKSAASIEVNNKDSKIEDISQYRKEFLIGFPKDSNLANDVIYRWGIFKDPEIALGNENTNLPSFAVMNDEVVKIMNNYEASAKKLVEKNPGDLSPYVSLISLYISNKAYSKALEFARLLKQKRADDPNVTLLINNIIAQIDKKYEEAYTGNYDKNRKAIVHEQIMKYLSQKI